MRPGQAAFFSTIVTLALVGGRDSAAAPHPPGLVVANHAEITPAPAAEPTRPGPFTVRFLPADWPNVTVKTPRAWNWTGHGRLLLDLNNPGKERIDLGIRVDDDPSSDGVVHCRTAETSIGPGESVYVAVVLQDDPLGQGMRGLPGQEGVRTLRATGKGPFDLGNIVAWQIFVHRPKAPQTLELRNALISPTTSLIGIVDRFGQYTRDDWPGKLIDASELATRRNAELANLKAHPALPDRDRFGGWAKGPQLRATGFFRVEKVAGKWWLVDPDGRLCFSSGIDDVRPDLPTFVEGRRAMFTWLPETGDPLARFLGTTNNVHSGPLKRGRTFDFYGANLARKYGQGYVAAWKDVAMKRLPSWGFNTFGNWSDHFHRNGRVPYVATVGVWGDHARVSSGSDYWGKMHDPFDPRFAADLERSVREIASEVKGDPYCLGYFVDNELSWGDAEADGDAGRYGLAIGTLEESEGSPAKAALLAQLQKKYRDVDRLNAAWKTRFRTWRELAASWRPALPLAEGLRTDLAAFVTEFARRYFRTVRDQLRKADSSHLYLGCRFARYTPEVVRAASEFCDVVSFNIYARKLDPAKWAFVNELERPCLIGEFHVGALDRGMFHTGLVAAADQQERAAVFTDYVRSVLDHPAFVGCHWFEYADEPLTGRTFDGENYAIGFVSVTDTPYPEMVAAARAVHAEAYPRRFAAGRQSTPAPPR